MNKKLLLVYLIILIILIIIAQLIIPKQNKENNSVTEQLKKISYYKKENLSRYLSYKQLNNNLSINEIITNVNIGLDNPYYTNTKETTIKDPILILVNKYNYLKNNYIPSNLETINEKYSTSQLKLVLEAKLAFEQLSEEAAKHNLNIKAMSAYRSYTYQETLYNRYVQKDGSIKADTYSARPGHSEHQTGLAVDVHNTVLPYTSFDKTNEFTWMKENAHKYGFILRYPKDKTNITGYDYEPWHYRYIGIEHATYIYENNITFDEYYIKYLDK